jgi:Zn-dependent M28 family amino/carboxypeptidase
MAGRTSLPESPGILDSINIEGGATAPAHGADDNGSAGLLEIARALSKHSGQHDVRFILFGGSGGFGSLIC